MHHPCPQQRLTGFQLFDSLVLDTFKIKFTHKKTVLAKLIIFSLLTQFNLRPRKVCVMGNLRLPTHTILISFFYHKRRIVVPEKTFSASLLYVYCRKCLMSILAFLCHQNSIGCMYP